MNLSGFYFCIVNKLFLLQLSAHTIDLSLQGSPHWMAPEVFLVITNIGVASYLES